MTPNAPSSGSCYTDVLCSAGIPWHKEKASVALILRNGNAWCSGALINNTLDDGKEYFLTAKHCYDFGSSEGNNTAASGSVFVFNKESPSCNGPQGPTTMSVSGSTIKSSWLDTDFALLELNHQVPTSFYPYYSGWYRAWPIPANSTLIHHPNGADKKITFDFDPPQVTGWYIPPSFCSNDPGNDHWKILDWDVGSVDHGSSGGPLYNPNFRIIGQLHGGCSFCNNNSACYCGRLYNSWTGGGSQYTQLSYWLDPIGLSSPVNYFGLRYIRYYTVNQDAWYTGDIVKFHDVDILPGYNVVVTELQDKFEATGTLDIPLGTTFEVIKP